MEDLLRRVASLESASKTVQEELLSIQKENILLQKDALKAQRDKYELKEQYDALQADMKRMIDASKSVKHETKPHDEVLELITDAKNQFGENLQQLEAVKTDIALMKYVVNENKQWKDKVMQLDAMQADITLMKGIIEGNNQLKDKVQRLDTAQADLADEMGQWKDRVMQLDTVQADVTQLKQWAADSKQLKEKLKKIEAQIKQKTDDNKQLKDTLKKIDAVQADVDWIKQKTDDNEQLKDTLKANDQTTSVRMAQLGNFQRVLSRAMVDGHRDDDDVKKEVTKVSNMLAMRITRLEQRAAEEKKSEVLVHMDTSKLQLITGQNVKINKSKKVDYNVGGCFDASSCRVRTKVAGRYLINVLSQQTGTGKISIRVKSHDGSSVSMGCTTGDNDSQVSTIVLPFNAQDNLWLQAKREDGLATLLQCWLYVRLLQSDN